MTEMILAILTKKFIIVGNDFKIYSILLKVVLKPRSFFFTSTVHGITKRQYHDIIEHEILTGC